MLISILTTFAKLLVKDFYDQLGSLVYSKSIIQSNQFEFYKNKSTPTATKRR